MQIDVIGGGLAGCEAAYALARQGIAVTIWEMRPDKQTPVHQSGDLAELVCSNSLKSEQPDTAQGLLKMEMRILGSLLLDCAEMVRVPAGSALAVDRVKFSRLVTERIRQHPLISVRREEAGSIPAHPCIIATGPLTSEAMALALQEISGEENLYFYDAVAPTVTRASLDEQRVFKASRYGKGSADYYNCPMNKEEYLAFYQALLEADALEPHAADQGMVFESCMPIEFMARRGVDTLRFGPMRPVGLADPEGGPPPYAVVQLRQEDQEGNLWGLVGFQTRLRWGEQERVFRLIPGLKNAEFVRYGVMHRNTYINSPRCLNGDLQFKSRPGLFLAGQLTGVEGYMESAASGIWAGISMARYLQGKEPLTLPRTTMLGALIHHITTVSPGKFQPMNANYGLLPDMPQRIKDKKRRNQAYMTRSLYDLRKFSELL
ncbi:MAG: methylenetetrahydrofolate--tRNA-(uracil(54)-C(5))-methyltransferase (FADH(2)-oxidizing) TrmFO [Syntrophomonadaceae bacterium]|nr:methylenetetrahydrofolate--tRNA-(uracil(54)-C(5))-methyltransferase (FADH(2)-oxidizing) TrmFO [Syntrophomonadaceae bacterium]